MRYTHFSMLPELAFKRVGGRMTYEGGGGKNSAPPAPDYTGAAAAQGAADKEIATQTTWANRPTVNTPWGSSTWGAGTTTDPASGQQVTQWNQNINLSPAQQQALDSQQAIQAGRSSTAQSLLGQVAQSTSTPFNWGSLPSTPGSVGDAQQSAFQRMAASLQPMRDQQADSLETRLANMGLPMNSEAYNRAKAAMQAGWAQENKGLLAQAGGEGREDIRSQVGLRQQAIAEEAQRRGMSLNEMNALLTGQQVSMPQGMSTAPNTTAQPYNAPNFLGAAQSAGQYGLGQAQLASQGGTNWGSALGGIASVGSLFL